MTDYRALLRVELRRLWTAPIIAIVAGVAALGALIALSAVRPAKPLEITRLLVQFHLTFFLPIVVAVFTVGVVSNDVRSGWFRTLLMRPVTRPGYLFIKMAVALVSVWATLLIGVSLPLCIVAVLKGPQLEFTVGQVLAAYAALIAQSALLITILTFLSCWFHGVLNVVFLLLWSMAVSIGDTFVKIQFWDSKWLTVLVEYLFPSGFYDAATAISSRTHVPYAELLWGIAALAGFAALAVWSINRIEVERYVEQS